MNSVCDSAWVLVIFLLLSRKSSNLVFQGLNFGVFLFSAQKKTNENQLIDQIEEIVSLDHFVSFNLRNC